MARASPKRPLDHTLLIRRTVQMSFLLLNLWIGVRFYAWVRYFETGGASLYVPRPAGVEGWLPIATLMNLKYFALTGLAPEVHPAGMFLLIAFPAISLVFRKAFCSWLCPIGTLSEWLWQGGRDLFGKNWACPSLIPVDRLLTVRTPECVACLTCVSACPVKDALDMRLVVRRPRVPPLAIASGLTALFLLVVGYAKASGAWNGQTPEDLFFTLIPLASSLAHP